MITTQSRFNPVAKTLGKRTQFTVNLANRAHIMGILSGLYADPIKAVIRELSVNACESHKASGDRGPISITLPNHSGPAFIIRDAGLGLTLGEFEKLMASYGSSGEYKSTSNEYTGGFGLGCKAPAAYTDQWTVTCRKDGRRWILACFKDEFGVPAFDVLDESETDESNGVEIKIPVKQNDIDHFRRKAIEVFKDFSIKPNVVNATKEELEELHKVIPTVASDKNWKMYDREDQDSSYVIMGDVRYPINYSNFKLPDKLAIATQLNLSFDIEVGGVQVAPSREALMYTPMTVKRLTAEIDKVVTTLADVVKQKVASSPTWWDACLASGLFKQDWRYSGDLERFIKKVRKEVKWKGHDVDGCIVRPSVKVKDPSTGDEEEVGDDIKFWVAGWRSWGRNKLKVEEVNSILVGRKVKVYLVDNCKFIRKNQLRHCFDTNFFSNSDGSQYYFITTKIPFDKLVAKHPKLDFIRYELSSVLPEPPKDVTSTGSSGDKDIKHTKGKVFAFDMTKVGSYHNKASDLWLVSDGQFTDDDLWVCIEKFEVTHPFSNLGRSGSATFFKKLKDAGILKGRILARKKGEAFPEGAKLLEQEFKTLFFELLDNDPAFANKVWMAHEFYHWACPNLLSLAKQEFDKESTIGKAILNSKLDADHPATCIVALVNQKLTDQHRAMGYVFDKFNLQVVGVEKNKIKLDKYKPAKEMQLAWQEERLVKGWPMIRWASTSPSYWHGNTKKKTCFEKDLVSYLETNN